MDGRHGEPRQRQHGRSIARRIRVGGAARRAGKRTWDRGRARRTRLRGSCDARSRSSEPHAPSELSSVARPPRPSEDRGSGQLLPKPCRKSHEDGKIPAALGCVFLSPACPLDDDDDDDARNLRVYGSTVMIQRRMRITYTRPPPRSPRPPMDPTRITTRTTSPPAACPRRTSIET